MTLDKILTHEKEIRRIQEEHDWLHSQNLSQYAGHWLAILGKAIIARGKELKDVVKEVNEKGIDDQDPLYIRVPVGIVTI